MGALLALFVLPQAAFGAKESKGGAAAMSVEEIEKSRAGDPEAVLAALTDAQARELLLKKLRQQAAAQFPAGQEKSEGFVLRLIEGTATGIRNFSVRMQSLWADSRAELSAPERIVDSLSGGQGREYLARSTAAVAAVLLCAAAALLLQRYFFHRFFLLVSAQFRTTPFARTRVFILGCIQHAVSLGVYFAIYTLLALAVLPDGSAERRIADIVFAVLTYALVLEVFARLLLSPGTAWLRPLPLGDGVARAVYRLLLTIIAGVSLLAAAGVILGSVAGAPATGALLHASAGVFCGLNLSVAILANRARMTEALMASDTGADAMRSGIVRHWHVPALAYALFIGGYWSVRSIVVEESLLRLVLSMFLIPLCIGADMWVRNLLAFAVDHGRSRPANDVWGDEPAEHSEVPLPDASPPGAHGRTIADYVPLITRLVRMVIIVAPVFIMLRIWGVSVPMGWLLARNVLVVVLVVLGSLLFWEIIRIQIDRKLREEIALSGIDPDEMDEGGGTGGSRTATLLVLLRKFVLTVIVVMGVMLTLSSMGVDIGPLIAGAGVFGLAIGFGAQTLVKDIISGVFFLVDDAFRVGDYVEAGAAKGTVEQISLRSMKLRHPRGMVYNVPYGSLKILQNFSRDYIISKLDFRIRYDADIDKIRKVIKRINKEMQADAEFRDSLLGDIKSNGVRGMEDSAMILRVKFRSLPGHQFILQKEVYRRVQEAFRKNGIEFAHRNVTVFLQPDMSVSMSGEGKGALAAAGGAAAAVLQQEEERALAAAQAAASQKSEGDGE